MNPEEARARQLRATIEELEAERWRLRSVGETAGDRREAEEVEADLDGLRCELARLEAVGS